MNLFKLTNRSLNGELLYCVVLVEHMHLTAVAYAHYGKAFAGMLEARRGSLEC
jgi:hypothetical protein